MPSPTHRTVQIHRIDKQICYYSKWLKRKPDKRNPGAPSGRYLFGKIVGISLHAE